MLGRHLVSLNFGGTQVKNRSFRLRIIIQYILKIKHSIKVYKLINILKKCKLSKLSKLFKFIISPPELFEIAQSNYELSKTLISRTNVFGINEKINENQKIGI